MKIQEPSSSIRETERKESPEWQCTSVPPLEGTREWQNPVTTTFLLFIPGEPIGAVPLLSRGALPRPHVLVSQRNARILYASETTRQPANPDGKLVGRHSRLWRRDRAIPWIPTTRWHRTRRLYGPDHPTPRRWPLQKWFTKPASPCSH